MSLVIDEHRQYLADKVRLAAFMGAIARTVRSGDVVLDLGAGTGILGLLACRAGASRVYAIEADDIAGLTRELAVANGYGDRVTVIRELSTRAVLPEPVDVIVTDQIGAFGFDAGFLEYVADACARFLKPGGRTVPVRVALHLCPCQAPQIRDCVEFWSSRPAGFDFGLVRPMAASTGYRGAVEASDLVAGPAAVAMLDPSAGHSPRFHVTADFDITRNGVIDALAGWFVAELAPGVEMTNGPHDVRINRRHVLLPFDPPIEVAPGDRLHLTLRIWPADTFVAWDAELWRRGAAAPVHLPRRSTFGGMLLSREDLMRHRNDHYPGLTPAGHVRLSILQLADGSRTLEDIERLVAERHPDVLPSRDAAEALVAEVLTRYAE